MYGYNGWGILFKLLWLCCGGWGRTAVRPYAIFWGRTAVRPYAIFWGRTAVRPYAIFWGRTAVRPYAIFGCVPLRYFWLCAPMPFFWGGFWALDGWGGVARRLALFGRFVFLGLGLFAWLAGGGGGCLWCL